MDKSYGWNDSAFEYTSGNINNISTISMYANAKISDTLVVLAIIYLGHLKIVM